MYNIVIKKNDRFYFMLLAMCMLLGMLSPNMSAQGMSNADITGKVVDQYGNPVSDVTVTMKNSNFKAVTGVDGIFKFQLNIFIRKRIPRIALVVWYMIPSFIIKCYRLKSVPLYKKSLRV